MTADLDTYRTAKVLIDRYGDGASLHPASRADELLEMGDMEGRAVWLRIQEAVLELLKDAPGEVDAPGVGAVMAVKAPAAARQRGAVSRRTGSV